MLNLTSHDYSLFADIGSFTSFPQWFLIPFVLISIIESILGIVGNVFVIIVITFIGKSTIPHRLHNCFIVNLALSDLVLCLFTMPLNTYRSIYVYMTFPPAFCKLADSFPAINVCVSSLTIVTIAIYRYLIVYYPHKKFNSTLLIIIIMISIWLLSILAASPLFIYSSSSKVHDEFFIETMIQIKCLHSIDEHCQNYYNRIYRRLHVCHELWPKHSYSQLFYTIFMFVLQFILPILIICITYYQVMLKLRERFRHRFLTKRHNLVSLRHEIRRQRRNNLLLLLIVSSYAISWLPYNISSTVFTYINQYQNKTENDLSKYLPLRFLISMISSITNPFLYGYFNETFKDGLGKIFSVVCPKLIRTKNNIYYDQTDIPSLELTLTKHQNGGLASRSNFYQFNLQDYSFNDLQFQKQNHPGITNKNPISTKLI